MVKNYSDTSAADQSTPKQHQDHNAPAQPRSYINRGDEDQMEIIGYLSHPGRTYLTWCLYILTGGLLRLVFHWCPQWKLIATHTRCPLVVAEKVLIMDNYKGKMKSYFVKTVEILSATNTKETNLTKSQSIISINGLIFSKELDQNQKNSSKLTVYLCDGTTKKLSEVRLIRCKKLMYIWDEDKNEFVKLAGLDRGIRAADLHSTYKGYNTQQHNLKKIVYGPNTIHVPVQSIVTLLVLEALTPFYIFQLFSLIVWLCEYYYYYAVAIILMSVFGISTSIIQTRKNQMNLKGTVHSSDKIFVSRSDGIYEEIPTTDLVPGDLIVIPAHGCEMQCDAVLLNGNCIVNESMLTGESVPVTKTALPNNNNLYNVKEHSNHTLFCGTKVIQTRYYANENVLAVVVRTGYLTTKGQLVRSILYPPPADFKFDQDSYKFIIILTVIAFLGFIYTIFSKYSRDIAPFDILIKALDLVTIAVPPALPAAMTVGKLYALNRLKKSNIYCINSRVINVSGSVDCVCFDKTGTLTEDGLDLWGVVPVINGNESMNNPVKNVKTLPINSPLFQGMLTCHALTIIDDKLCGDPLDIKMFESTGWLLEEPKIPDNCKYDLLVPIIAKSPNLPHEEIGIIQQYQFSSTLQRMTTIVKHLNRQCFDVYCKGSPEIVTSLCRPDSVPSNMTEILNEYTKQGYRVIAMATKTLPSDTNFHKIVHQLHRDDIECNLTLVGLIILENRLKPQTIGVIRTLKEAGMKLAMITGDNILTAISVARECEIIHPDRLIVEVITKPPTKTDNASVQYKITGGDNGGSGHFGNSDVIASSFIVGDIEQSMQQQPPVQLVVTGNSWSNLHQYYPDLIPKIVRNGVVFARMSGHQKQQLIEELQNLGYYVAMCGDGANDCGALKAAHVGISLSEAEASVASPFTSKDPNIGCVPKIIREGRAALVTSFGVFKLMLCYSLTEFASVIILYAIDSNLTSLQFLFIDICLILNFASFFGNTKAHERLHKTPPMTSLLSFVPLTSIILFMFVIVLFQIISYYFIQTFTWFVPFQFNPNDTTYYTSYENYAVYSISMFQYIIMAVVFSKGKPYRKPIYTNYFFTISALIMIGICSYIVVYPSQWIVDGFEMKMPPFYDGRIAILAIALINFVVCFIVEDIIVDIVLYKFVKTKKPPSALKSIADDDWYRIVRHENHINYGYVNEKQDGDGNHDECVVITRC